MGPAAVEGNGLLAVSKLTQLRSLAICLPSYSKQLLDGLKLLTALRVSQKRIGLSAISQAGAGVRELKSCDEVPL